MDLAPTSLSARSYLPPVFISLAALQFWHLLRAARATPLPHFLTNLTVGAAAAVPVRLLVIPVGLATTTWAGQRRFGILNWIAGPGCLKILIAFVLLDFGPACLQDLAGQGIVRLLVLTFQKQMREVRLSIKRRSNNMDTDAFSRQETAPD